ncbi:MAG: VirB3 family type IV secretion system protein [Candidatus Omnitrophica bacterium]|nr:VirB3 family type IV secretion system protein [Candidatus Omnitrophota bacterium]
MKISIHQSLVKPLFIAGVERELAIALIFLCLMLWVAGKDLISLCLAIVIWIAGTAAGRALNKKEEYWLKIYLRHIKYQAFYPAGER